jgi:hypothetical protein
VGDNLAMYAESRRPSGGRDGGCGERGHSDGGRDGRGDMGGRAGFDQRERVSGGQRVASSGVRGGEHESLQQRSVGRPSSRGLYMSSRSRSRSRDRERYGDRDRYRDTNSRRDRDRDGDRGHPLESDRPYRQTTSPAESYGGRNNRWNNQGTSKDRRDLQLTTTQPGNSWHLSGKRQPVQSEMTGEEPIQPDDNYDFDGADCIEESEDWQHDNEEFDTEIGLGYDRGNVDNKHADVKAVSGKLPASMLGSTPSFNQVDKKLISGMLRKRAH